MIFSSEVIKMSVKDLRKKKKMTQAELAKATGVSASAVSSWECGARFPRQSTFAALCRVLDCRPNDIYLDNAAADDTDMSEKTAAPVPEMCTTDDAVMHELRGIISQLPFGKKIELIRIASQLLYMDSGMPLEKDGLA